MAFIQERKTGALVSWASTLLEHCRGGPHRTAMSVATVCRSNDDRELLRDFAIHLLQELQMSEPIPLSSLEKAKRMPKPYSTFYNAEDHEHLFFVLDSLLKPDVYHSENRACRSARALWSPLRADRMLWAKQAWEYPELDAKASSSIGGAELVHFHPSTTLPAPLPVTTEKGRNNTNPKTRRSLSKWVHKWCHAFEIPPDQWILILPSRDLCTVVDDSLSTTAKISKNQNNYNNNDDKNNDHLQLLPQLVKLQWNWLLETLRTALLEWRLDAMFPTLVHPVIHNHWKIQQQEHNSITMQCIVFIARVYCAMKALQWDSMESPVLLTKVLRCATLLQEEASCVFEQVDLKVLAQVPRIILSVEDAETGTITAKTITTETTIHKSTGLGTMVTQEEKPFRHEMVPDTRWPVVPSTSVPLPVPASVDVSCRNREDVLFLRKRKRDDTMSTSNTQAFTKITKR